jgi:hypothetical protein
MTVRFTTGHTADKEIQIPETEIESRKPEYKYEPLRGCGYVMAVFEADKCVGWITCWRLGFNSVKEWIDGTNVWDGMKKV